MAAVNLTRKTLEGLAGRLEHLASICAMLAEDPAAEASDEELKAIADIEAFCRGNDQVTIVTQESAEVMSVD